MPEKDLVSQRDALKLTTSTGRVFSQARASSADNPQTLSEDEADFLRKKQQLDAVTPDFFAEYQDVPKIVVVGLQDITELIEGY